MYIINYNNEEPETPLAWLFHSSADHHETAIVGWDLIALFEAYHGIPLRPEYGI